MHSYNYIKGRVPVCAGIVMISISFLVLPTLMAYDGPSFSEWEEVGPADSSIANRLLTPPPLISSSPSNGAYREPAKLPSDFSSVKTIEKLKDEVYVVQSGDTLPKIAQKVFGDSGKWQELMEINKIENGDRIFVGQQLILSAKGSLAKNNKKTELVSKNPVEVSFPEINNTNDDDNESISANAGNYGSRFYGQSGGMYTVQRGDTLGKISERIFGTSQKWRDIANANPSLNPNRLEIGQKIIIPGVELEVAPKPKMDVALVVADPLGTPKKSYSNVLSSAPPTFSTPPAIAPSDVSRKSSGGLSYQEGLSGLDSTSYSANNQARFSPASPPPPPPVTSFSNGNSHPVYPPVQDTRQPFVNNNQPQRLSEPSYFPSNQYSNNQLSNMQPRLPMPPAPYSAGIHPQQPPLAQGFPPPPPMVDLRQVPTAGPSVLHDPPANVFFEPPPVISSRELYSEDVKRLPKELRPTTFTPYFTNFNGYHGLIDVESALLPYATTWRVGMHARYRSYSTLTGEKDVISGHEIILPFHLTYSNKKLFMGLLVPFQSWETQKTGFDGTVELAGLHDPKLNLGYQIWQNMEGTHAVTVHTEGQFPGSNYHQPFINMSGKSREGVRIGPAGATRGAWGQVGAAYSGKMSDKWTSHINFAYAHNPEDTISKTIIRGGIDYRVNDHFAIISEINTTSYNIDAGTNGTNTDMNLGFIIFSDVWQAMIGFDTALQSDWGYGHDFGLSLGLSRRWY